MPIGTVDELDEIRQGISALTVEARPAWIMARVASLLSQYYAADVPQAAVAMMAEDWLDELREYPQWAITKAVRWWKSADNADRKKRPLEGDISARCKREMGIVDIARVSVRRGIGTAPPANRLVTPVNGAAANEIVARAGFTPKRFNGDA